MRTTIFGVVIHEPGDIFQFTETRKIIAVADNGDVCVGCLGLKDKVTCGELPHCRDIVWQEYSNGDGNGSKD